MNGPTGEAGVGVGMKGPGPVGADRRVAASDQLLVDLGLSRPGQSLHQVVLLRHRVGPMSGLSLRLFQPAASSVAVRSPRRWGYHGVRIRTSRLGCVDLFCQIAPGWERSRSGRGTDVRRGLRSALLLLVGIGVAGGVSLAALAGRTPHRYRGRPVRRLRTAFERHPRCEPVPLLPDRAAPSGRLRDPRRALRVGPARRDRSPDGERRPRRGGGRRPPWGARHRRRGPRAESGPARRGDRQRERGLRTSTSGLEAGWPSPPTRLSKRTRCCAGRPHDRPARRSRRGWSGWSASLRT